MTRKKHNKINERLRQIVGEMVSAEIIDQAAINAEFWQRVKAEVQPRFQSDDYDVDYGSFVELQLRACTSESPHGLMNELAALTADWRTQQLQIQEAGRDAHEYARLVYYRGLAAELRDNLQARIAPRLSPTDIVDDVPPPCEQDRDKYSLDDTEDEKRYIACALAAGVDRRTAVLVIGSGATRDWFPGLGNSRPSMNHRLSEASFWAAVRDKIVPLMREVIASAPNLRWHQAMDKYLELAIRRYVLDESPEDILRQARRYIQIVEELRDQQSAGDFKNPRTLLRDVEQTGLIADFIRRLQNEKGSTTSPHSWQQRLIDENDQGSLPGNTGPRH